MNKKKLFISIAISIILLTLLFWLIFMESIPRWKYNQKYEVPQNLTAEETIEKYFEYINDRNPSVANNILVNRTLGVYCCREVISAEIYQITLLDDNGYDYPKSYQTASFNVEFNVKYLSGDGLYQVMSGMGNCTNFYLIKETENDIWKICDMGM